MNDVRDATEVEQTEILRGLREGRLFRVVREGASFGWGYRNGDRKPIPLGSVVRFRRWVSDDDGDLTPIWESLRGREIDVGGGTMVYRFQWAVFHPWVAMKYPRGSFMESVLAPDPTYLEPIDDKGRPEPW